MFGPECSHLIQEYLSRNYFQLHLEHPTYTFMLNVVHHHHHCCGRRVYATEEIRLGRYPLVRSTREDMRHCLFVVQLRDA